MNSDVLQACSALDFHALLSPSTRVRDEKCKLVPRNVYTDTPHIIKLFISFPQKKVVCQNRNTFKAALIDMFVLTVTKYL